MPESAKTALIRPPQPITAFVTSVHHLTNETVAHAPAWDLIAPYVQEDLHGAWIAAHNASMDYNVLRRHLPTWEPAGVIDTLRLAHTTYPTGTRHGLDALLAHIDVDPTAIPGRRYRAGFDAHATALLLIDLAAHYPTWDALIAVAVPPGMPGSPSSPHRDEEQTLW
ncbi:3'-5' exonuclease [Embleya sp. NPDC005971]|uniref:3'-5' exonuclease n=1 Tax=Embleya sp. NPDC005971 TaxID=3156724 RepID=UPI00340C5720